MVKKLKIGSNSVFLSILLSFYDISTKGFIIGVTDRVTYHCVTTALPNLASTANEVYLGLAPVQTHKFCTKTPLLSTIHVSRLTGHIFRLPGSYHVQHMTYRMSFLLKVSYTTHSLANEVEKRSVEELGLIHG